MEKGMKLVDFIRKYATKENLKKLDEFLKKANTLLNKYGDVLADNLKGINKSIESSIEPLCDVTEITFLSKDTIKEIITSYDTVNFSSVALLKAGYNNKTEKHLYYMQFLDDDNNVVDENTIICIVTDNVDLSLKASFQKKELLILK